VQYRLKLSGIVGSRVKPTSAKGSRADSTADGGVIATSPLTSWSIFRHPPKEIPTKIPIIIKLFDSRININLHINRWLILVSASHVIESTIYKDIPAFARTEVVAGAAIDSIPTFKAL
jgi:hypothetical protein